MGQELCRDEAYLDAATKYTVELMTAVYIIHFIPVWMRPFLSPFIPQVRKLQRRIRQVEGFLKPIVVARRDAVHKSGYQKPDDLLQWIIDSQMKLGEQDDQELAKLQLGVSFAAIHTTTLTTTNA